MKIIIFLIGLVILLFVFALIWLRYRTKDPEDMERYLKRSDELIKRDQEIIQRNEISKTYTKETEMRVKEFKTLIKQLKEHLNYNSFSKIEEEQIQQLIIIVTGETSRYTELSKRVLKLTLEQINMSTLRNEKHDVKIEELMADLSETEEQMRPLAAEMDTMLEKLKTWLALAQQRKQEYDAGNMKQMTPRTSVSSDSATVPQVSQTNVADELIKLKSLLDDGILTQEEFSEQKKKVLDM